MKNTFTYRIDNYDKFISELLAIVDTTVDCKCNSIDPTLLKSEYFGKLENDQFTIYHSSCELAINGEKKGNNLILNFYFPKRFNSIFDIILFTIVGGSIMYDINFFMGLAVCLFVIIQKSFVFYSEEKKKHIFLQKIEEILEKC